jgi:hypothetical protein
VNVTKADLVQAYLDRAQTYRDLAFCLVDRLPSVLANPLEFNSVPQPRHAVLSLRERAMYLENEAEKIEMMENVNSLLKDWTVRGLEGA